MSEETKEKSYPLQRVPHERVKYVAGGFKGWHIIWVNDSPIAKSTESANI